MICFIDLQYRKADRAITSKLSGKWTVDSFPQPEKAARSITFRWHGRVNLRRALQNMKQHVGIRVKLGDDDGEEEDDDENLTDVKPEQHANAYLPSVCKDFGNSMYVKEQHPENASFSMDRSAGVDSDVDEEDEVGSKNTGDISISH